MISGIHGFNHRSAFSTWLHRITMNTACSFLKRRKRNPVENREEPPDPPAVSLSQPAATAMAREMNDQVAAALAECSPSLRAAIVLIGIYGMSVREAAHAARCLAATMYWRVHLAELAPNCISSNNLPLRVGH